MHLIEKEKGMERKAMNSDGIMKEGKREKCELKGREGSGEVNDENERLTSA